MKQKIIISIILITLYSCKERIPDRGIITEKWMQMDNTIDKKIHCWIRVDSAGYNPSFRISEDYYKSIKVGDIFIK